MGIILWIIFGALVGWIASLVTTSKHGIVADVVLGIVGAFIGGILMNFLGQPGVTGFNIYSILVGVIGSVVLIFIGRIV